MLTTETFDQIISLLEDGYSYPSITEEIGITQDEATAVGSAYFKGETEQFRREVQLAGFLEVAAATLRSGKGWDEGATNDVLNQILHVYPEGVKRAVGQALLSEKL
jgi:hypothetical protein